MTLPKKIKLWIHNGLIGCAFVLIGLLAIPACISLFLIVVVWQGTEALLKWLERKR